MQSITAKINIAVLSLCVLLFLLLPYKNNIWYDESVSVLCSQGITYDTHDQFSNATTITSADITALNDYHHVFLGTLMDNSNSYLYNISLHYFTRAFGNNLHTYVFFSRLWGIICLLALFFLCRLLFGDSLAVAAGLLLVFTGFTFWGMANEVRAYAMGICFLVLAVLFLVRYLQRGNQPWSLFLFGMCSLFAVLSHFFCAYVIVVCAFALLFRYGLSFFSVKNLLVLTLPIMLLVVYFIIGHNSLSAGKIHTVVVNNKDMGDYSITGMVLLLMKYTAVNFKIIYPQLRHSSVVLFISFFAVIFIYVYGLLVLARKSPQRYNFHLLFFLGMSASIFLGIVSLKNHTLSAFYFRYFSFSGPFCAVFIAMFLQLLFGRYRNKLLLSVLAVILVLPNVVFFTVHVGKITGRNDYNHIAVARMIIDQKIAEIEVPSWDDAFLVQSFLPAGSNISYILNTTSHNFIIHKDNTVETLPVTGKPL